MECVYAMYSRDERIQGSWDIQCRRNGRLLWGTSPQEIERNDIKVIGNTSKRKDLKFIETIEIRPGVSPNETAYMDTEVHFWAVRSYDELWKECCCFGEKIINEEYLRLNKWRNRT